MRENEPFTVKGKGRHYKSPTNGENLPSVTNILDCYPKQHALVRWSANRQKEFDVAAAYELYKATETGLAFRDAEAFKKSLDAYIGKQRQHITDLEKAGEIGSRVHHAISEHIKTIMGIPFADTPTLEGAALWAYMAWEDWFAKCDVTPLASEKFVWSDEFGYAGTADLIAEVVINEALLKKVAPKFRSTKLVSCLGQKVLCLGDFKTSRGVYLDMFLQLAAYIEAEKPSSDMWGMIVRLPKTEDDPEFEVRLLMPEDRRQKFETFLAVKKIWEDKHYYA